MSNDMKNDTPGSPVGKVGITPTPVDGADKGNCLAFPMIEPCHEGTVIHFGMSLRDWFAGQALAGLLANSINRAYDIDASMAYNMADAMLRARKGDGT